MAASDDLQGMMLRQGPSSGTLFVLLSQMKQEGDLRRLIQTGTRALDMYPADIPIRKLMAEAFLEAGMVSQAEAQMEKVSQQIRDLASIYKPKAELLARQRRPREALQAIKIYLAHHPDDQDALDLLQGLAPSEEAPVEGGPEFPHEEGYEGPYEEISQPLPEAPHREEEPPPPEFKQEIEPEFEQELEPEPEQEFEREIEGEIEPEPEQGFEQEFEGEPEPEIPPQAEVPVEPAPAEAGPSPAPDIATPTLAEIYIAQGQRQEAIRTYERVLELHPEDESSRQRLQEIRNVETPVVEAEISAPVETREDAPAEAPADEGGRMMKEKTEKMITTLEMWLEEIREMAKPLS